MVARGQSLSQGQAPELRGLHATLATPVFEWSTGDPTLALGPTRCGMLWPGRPPLETTGWQARGSRASWGSAEMEVLTITLEGTCPCSWIPATPGRASWALQLPPAHALSLDRCTRPPRRGPPRRAQPTPTLTPPSAEMLTCPQASCHAW